MIDHVCFGASIINCW